MNTVRILKRMFPVVIMALLCLPTQARPHHRHAKPSVAVVKKCGCKCKKHHRHNPKTKRIIVVKSCR